MRLGQYTLGFLAEEIFFAIFRKYPISSIDNIFLFIEYVQQKYIFFKEYFGVRILYYVKLVFHCVLPFYF